MNRPLPIVLRIIAVFAATILLQTAACHDGGGPGDPAPEPSGPGPSDFIPDNDARASAFRLFYRERMERVLLAYNRFALAGDAVPATAIGKHAIARRGDRWEDVPGPNDNNPIGHSAYTAFQAYKAFGGRPMELTLIRLFEGLAFMEGVSGHPGLTCREALPGWTRVMDGVAGTVTRFRDGKPVDPPVAFPAALEREILTTFFDGVVVTYREDPSEYYFAFKPVNELEDFAITFVFAELPHYLRISNCCSSWMITRRGPWRGAFWGNHNSRDNFPDLALGYLAAAECAGMAGAPADLREAARHAAEAGERVGNAITESGGVLMTVDEHHSYDVLTPAGQVRPDATTEWQDLGSMASCQMAYLAQALSSEGLDTPVPALPLPGSLETSALGLIFDLIGLEQPDLPVRECTCLDDAYLGIRWGDLLHWEIMGVPWTLVAEVASRVWPDLFPGLFGSAIDDFNEMEMAAVGLCLYAEQNAKPDLLAEAREALANLVGIQRVLAMLLYKSVGDSDDALRKGAEEELYKAAVRARMFDIPAPCDDFLGFAPGESQNTWIESQLNRGETAPWRLLSDGEIRTRIEVRLEGVEPWIKDRYRERFGDVPPVRRAGDAYEAVGPDGEWVSAENPEHEWFGGFKLWFEVPLCNHDRSTLDCAWAAAGCKRADLDRSGQVDDADHNRFHAAWKRYRPLFREPVACGPGNDWCEGVDLDRSGEVDSDDRAFMAAADGCWW